MNHSEITQIIKQIIEQNNKMLALLEKLQYSSSEKRSGINPDMVNGLTYDEVYKKMGITKPEPIGIEEHDPMSVTKAIVEETIKNLNRKAEEKLFTHPAKRSSESEA